MITMESAKLECSLITHAWLRVVLSRRSCVLSGTATKGCAHEGMEQGA